MYKDKLIELKALIDTILQNEPDDEELNYDNDAIEVYANIHNLKEAMETMGF